MVEVDAALRIVLQHANELPEISVSLDGLTDRTLQEMVCFLKSFEIILNTTSSKAINSFD